MDLITMFRWLRRRPFVPFRLRLGSGIVHEVRNQELVVLRGRSLVLELPEVELPIPRARQYFEIALRHIIQVEEIVAVPPPTRN